MYGHKVRIAMVSIETYLPSQTRAIGELIVGIQTAEFQIPITLEAQPDLRDIQGFYQQGNGNFWVALDREEVIGTIALLDIGNRQAALRKMFVHQAYRGAERGVAKMLLGTLLDWSRKSDIAEIFLGTTEKFVAAHRFYERNGFVEIDLLRLPPSFPVMAVDSKFYRCAIAS
jgi:N-acetylglutamate synthase-like GNAT family acetyltransferase